MTLANDLEERFRVPERGFRLADRDPADRAGLTKKQAKALRADDLERLEDLQARLYAEGRRSLLVVLQGLDASGKDGTIKHVMSGVNPQGVSVTSFKQPTPGELQHDFLWRTQLALPARGHIGVFNRSHYEEVLVVRVHPELLAQEAVDPSRAAHPKFWTRRLEEISAWERHLTNSGTRTIKFFLHISKAEQLKRFLARAEESEKNWKFSASDLHEHHYFDAYQHAYEAALKATSTAEEPWYVIPADHKWLLRAAVATIIVAHLSDMDPRYPVPSERQLAETRAAVKQLASAENGAGRLPVSKPSE
ncbi:MAG TPA: polyphosphate kinase 2 family protein [Solirubrobacteraceae bacterium]|nr:polyphosphate kinase 2 family protein [Solirubrobacteraceae bacterium]